MELLESVGPRPRQALLPKADTDAILNYVLYLPRLLSAIEEIECLAGQFRDTGLTYPHGQRPVTGENRWLRFL